MSASALWMQIMTASSGLQFLLGTSLGVLAYIYVGYPLLVWYRSRRNAKAIDDHSSPIKMQDATVSVVIVAHNEARILPRKIQSLLASENAWRIREILIGSDGSTDGTDRVLAELHEPRVKLISFSERRGKPSVLNDVVPKCQSDYVLLADARQLFDSKCLDRLLAQFEDPSVGVVSGELILRTESQESTAAAGIGFYWRYEKFIRRCESQWRGVPGATGACYMLRKELFQPIPPATILDDVAIPMQAITRGYRCLFEPQAVVFDEPSKSTGQESVRKRRTIAGVAQLACLFPQWLLPWKNPLWFEYISHKMLRLASPVFMALTLIANLALAELPLYRLLLLTQMAFYTSAFVGWCYQAAGRGSRLFGPPLMFVTLNVTTAAAIWDALFSRYRVVWQKTM